MTNHTHRTHRGQHATPTTLSAAVRSLTEAVVLLAGTPVLLTKLVGWPLPRQVPTREEVTIALQLRNFSDRLPIGILACALWVCWGLIVLSVAASILRSLRHVEIKSPRLVPQQIHRIAAKWVTAIALLAALLTKPAMAATSLDRPAVHAPISPQTNTGQRTLGVDIGNRGSTTQEFPAGSNDKQRVYVTQSRDSLWTIAEATLGSGSRWAEIFDLNRTNIPNPDIIPQGLALTIPASLEHESTTGAVAVEVQQGDNLWSMSRDALIASGETPTVQRTATLWREVVDLNTPTLRSSDPDLIYPGEHIEIPRISEAHHELPEGDSEQQSADSKVSDGVHDVEGSESPDNGSAIAASESSTTTIVTTTQPLTTRPPVKTLAESTRAPRTSRNATVSTNPTETRTSSSDMHTDDIELEAVPIVLGLTGLGAASVLAALQRKRRRLVDEGSRRSLPTLTDAQVTLISDLRGLAEPDRLDTLDRTLRHLAKQAAISGCQLPHVSVVRAGEQHVELVSETNYETCPPGFALLNATTMILDPTNLHAERDPDTEQIPPLPGVIAIGTDATGDILIDLERISSVSIEADTAEAATAFLTGVAIEHSGLPWATSNSLLTIGLPEHLAVLEHIETIHDISELIELTRKKIDANSSELLSTTTHDARIDNIELWAPTIILIGPGHDTDAQTLAELANQPNSNTAVIAAAPLPVNHWRLVLTNDTAELEPSGLTFTPRFQPVNCPPEAAEQLVELLEEPPHPLPELLAHTIETTITPELSTLAPMGLESGTLFDLRATEPVSTQNVDDLIAEILKPQEVELILLEDAPRLEGVTWNGKNAARADEIITFLALHGPACPRQISEALWPGKRNMTAQTSQAVSRARSLLGEHNGEPRITNAKRNSPYKLQHIGCDWHRFQQLTAAAKLRPEAEAKKLFDAALQLVKGQPFSGRRERAFEWAGDHQYETEIELAIGIARSTDTSKPS